jgi:hypothetical protein
MNVIERLALGIASGLALVAAVALAAAPAASPPDVVTSTSSVGRVEFPHRSHVEDFGVACVECHHETAAAPLAMPHPAYLEDYWLDCKVCHRAEAAAQPSQACSACHPEHPVRAADQTVSSKVAVHTSCWRCHESGTGREASAGCTFCHQRETVAPGSGAAAR